MQNIILSADGDVKVFSVPDAVAENLEKYCIDFCDKWLWNSPDAEKYRTKHGVCYDEEDFIEYLNKYIFPHEQSMLIKNLGAVLYKNLPDEYKLLPHFFF